MNQFITIKEASQLTGKAEITIRRMIKRLINKDSQETREMISREKTPSGYIYKVNKDFLCKHFGMDHLLNNQTDNQTSSLNNQGINQPSIHPDSQQEKDGNHSGKAGDQKDTQAGRNDYDTTIEMLKETISILREQLNAKDEQLANKHSENQELIRGNRESIATVNLLSKRLFLEEGKNGFEPEPEVINKRTEKAEPEIVDAQEETENEAPAGEKKGIFNFFR